MKKNGIVSHFGDTHEWIKCIGDIYKNVASKDIAWCQSVKATCTQPERGWMEFVLTLAGRRELSITLSDTWNPLTDIRKWLESIINLNGHLVADCILDNENDYTLLHYEKIMTSPQELGLVYLIHKPANEEIKKIWAIVKPQELVGKIYKVIKDALISVCFKLNDGAKEYYWNHPNPDIEDWESVVNLFHSENIEAYLPKTTLIGDPILASFRGDLESMEYMSSITNLKDYKITGFNNDLEFPLWAVPKALLYIIGNPQEWKGESKVKVTLMKEKLEALIEWWKTKYGIDATVDPDYHAYKECYFSDEDDCSLEEVLMEKDISSFVKSYHLEMIDLGLFCAVNKFQFDRVEWLLSHGANPCVEMGEMGSALERISLECSFLNTQWYACWERICSKDGKITDLYVFMRDFIGYAAHEKMYDLLAKSAPFTKGDDEKENRIE